MTTELLVILLNLGMDEGGGNGITHHCEHIDLGEFVC